MFSWRRQKKISTFNYQPKILGLDTPFDNIKNNYPDLCSDLAGVQINMNGIINYFESAVALLLTFYPYYNHHSSKNPHKPQILEINFKGISHSKNGVDLRCHTKSEYDNLN